VDARDPTTPRLDLMGERSRPLQAHNPDPLSALDPLAGEGQNDSLQAAEVQGQHDMDDAQRSSTVVATTKINRPRPSVLRLQGSLRNMDQEIDLARRHEA
jgi:hypothetical protein